MNLESFADRRELLKLCGNACNGVSTSDEFEKLQAVLLADATARQLYIHYLYLHQGLATRVALSEKMESQVAVVARPLLAQLVCTKLSPSIYSPRLLLWTICGGLAAYFVTVMALVPLARFTQSPRELLVTSSSEIVGTVVSVKWSSDAFPESKDSPIHLGKPLKIESGLMEIELNTGTKLVVEGPADWLINGNNSVSLRSGKVLARVPEQAIGFTVETPTAKIVDLGTEFDVEVDSTGETSVQVLEGTVEFSSNRKPADNAKAESSVRRLQAGEAAKTVASTRTIAATEFAPQTFARRVGSTNSGGTRMVDLKTAVATQSSEYHPTILRAQMAIDGDPQTVCHTNPDDTSAWVQIDLGQSRSIAAVVLHNRPMSAGWLRDITVKVLADDGKTIVSRSAKLNSKNSLWGREENFYGGPEKLSVDFRQAPRGRYIRIEREPCTLDDERIQTVDQGGLWLTACKHSLCLSEVEVFESIPATLNPKPTRKP